MKKLRGFEENLVMYYKKYLDRLEETVQGNISVYLLAPLQNISTTGSTKLIGDNVY